jgi:hypothetical protein
MRATGGKESRNDLWTDRLSPGTIDGVIRLVLLRQHVSFGRCAAGDFDVSKLCQAIAH